MDRKKAIREKHESGYNCAQAVLCSFADKLSVSEDELFRIAEGFGGGIGGTGGMCGAVSAMVMAAGLNKSGGTQKIGTKPQTAALVRELLAEFKEKNGTLVCRELKTEKKRSCIECMEDAAEILEKII